MSASKSRRIPLGRSTNLSTITTPTDPFGFISSSGVQVSGPGSTAVPPNNDNFSIRSILPSPTPQSRVSRRTRRPNIQHKSYIITLSNIALNTDEDIVRELADTYGQVIDIKQSTSSSEILEWQIIFDTVTDAALAFFDTSDRLKLSRANTSSFWILDDLSTKELNKIFRKYVYKSITKIPKLLEINTWIIIYNNEEDALAALEGINGRVLEDKEVKAVLNIS